MKKLLCVFVLLFTFCSACGYVPDNHQSDILPSSSVSDDPFVGGFTYEKENVFLEKEETPMIDNYYISYRHRDGSIERLVEYVEADASWRVVEDKLYFCPGDGLSVLSFSNKMVTAMVFPNEDPHYGVTGILDVEGEWLYCGGMKYVDPEDKSVASGPYIVDTRLYVKLDFSEFYEEDMDE